MKALSTGVCLCAFHRICSLDQGRCLETMKLSLDRQLSRFESLRATGHLGFRKQQAPLLYTTRTAKTSVAEQQERGRQPPYQSEGLRGMKLWEIARPHESAGKTSWASRSASMSVSGQGGEREFEAHLPYWGSAGFRYGRNAESLGMPSPFCCLVFAQLSSGR